MFESGFDGVFHFFGGLCFIAFGLRIDGESEMQYCFGLFGILQGEAAGALHDG